MTTAERLTSFTYAEYLKALEDSHIKLELRDGEIFAMAGGTLAHAQLAARATFLLQRALGTGCSVFSSDAKVLVESADLATFPDGSVVCGPAERAQHDPHALTNPLILVEVTSNSTERYDRGEKLRRYKQLASLQFVILVSHRARKVTLVRRTANGWTESELRSGEVVTHENPTIRFTVDELYEGISLEN